MFQNVFVNMLNTSKSCLTLHNPLKTLPPKVPKYMSLPHSEAEKGNSGTSS